jgi:hypothetical protein
MPPSLKGAHYQRQGEADAQPPAVSPAEAEALYRESEAEARSAGYCGLRHQQLVADLFKQKLGARTISE